MVFYSIIILFSTICCVLHAHIGYDDNCDHRSQNKEQQGDKPLLVSRKFFILSTLLRMPLRLYRDNQSVVLQAEL